MKGPARIAWHLQMFRVFYLSRCMQAAPVADVHKNRKTSRCCLWLARPRAACRGFSCMIFFFFPPPPRRNKLRGSEEKKSTRVEMQNNRKPLDKRIWQIVSCLICSWRLHVILLKPLIRAEAEFFCPHIVWTHQGGWLLLRSLLLCHKVDFIGNWKIPTVTPVFDNFTPLHYEKTGSVGITCII